MNDVGLKLSSVNFYSLAVKWVKKKLEFCREHKFGANFDPSACESKDQHIKT